MRKLLRDFWNRGPLTRARAGIAVVGVCLPYVARMLGAIVHGREWLDVYLDAGLEGLLVIEAFNAIAWGSLFALSYVVRKASPLIVPALIGFGFLGYVHASADLSAGGHAGIILVYTPIFAVPIFVVTFGLSVLMLGRGAPAETTRSRLPDS